MNVLVVGGASGLGRALVERCLARNDRVCILDVDEGGLAELAGRVESMHLDIGDAGSIASVVASLGGRPPFDLVAITAGISAVGRFETLDPERLSAVVAVNLTGPILLTTALLQAELLARGGRLVLVSSLSHFVGYPGASVYAATKQGLVGFARSIRREMRRDFGITVQVVAPGPMDTVHAERYAPPGSSRGRRSSPDAIAGAILGRRSGGVLVPGSGARMAALAGALFPRLMGRLMRRLIYDRF